MVSVDFTGKEMNSKGQKILYLTKIPLRYFMECYIQKNNSVRLKGRCSQQDAQFIFHKETFVRLMKKLQDFSNNSVEVKTLDNNHKQTLINLGVIDKNGNHGINGWNPNNQQPQPTPSQQKKNNAFFGFIFSSGWSYLKRPFSYFKSFFSSRKQ
jgi:hypothetical protein